jgi:hypothetical protein
MGRKIMVIALSIAVALGFSGISFAMDSDNLDITTVAEDKVVSVEIPAYATGSGNVYRDKMIKQEFSYQKYDEGEYYTYVYTRKLTMSRKDVKVIGEDAAISCKFGAFDKYSGDIITFGEDSEYDVIPAEESGVGVPIYLADVTVGDKTYTLSGYQIKATSFEKKFFGNYHATYVEVVNIPKDYDGFVLVTYGLDDEEYLKASEHESNTNGDKYNIYTEVLPFIDSSHIAFYKFE